MTLVNIGIEYPMVGRHEQRRDGILNETSNTIHKRTEGGSQFQTDCGAIHDIPISSLRLVRIADETSYSTRKCGRCFPQAKADSPPQGPSEHASRADLRTHDAPFAGHERPEDM